LYGVNMGAIALFTSIAMAAFLRPDFFHSPPPLQEQMLEGTSP